MTLPLWEKFAAMSPVEADAEAWDAGPLQGDIVSLDEILSHVDSSAGRNAALRRYIICLRNLQRENDRYGIEGGENGAAIDAAQAAVTKAFQELVGAQHALDREATS
jgi:hypothetical protein